MFLILEEHIEYVENRFSHAILELLVGRLLYLHSFGLIADSPVC
jgi:hypothetical protein